LAKFPSITVQKAKFSELTKNNYFQCWNGDSKYVVCSADGIFHIDFKSLKSEQIGEAQITCSGVCVNYVSLLSHCLIHRKLPWQQWETSSEMFISSVY